MQAVFAEVDPTPLAKWLEDFKRDHHPDREIAIYEGMAHAYVAYSAGRTLTADQKQDAYQIVLLRSGSPDEEVLQRVSLKALSLDDAREVLRNFKAPPAPITHALAPNP